MSSLVILVWIFFFASSYKSVRGSLHIVMGPGVHFNRYCTMCCGVAVQRSQYIGRAYGEFNFHTYSLTEKLISIFTYFLRILGGRLPESTFATYLQMECWL